MNWAKQHAIDHIVEILIDLTECTIDHEEVREIATAAVESALESVEMEGK